MPARKFELKSLTREEWLAMDKQALKNELDMLDKECPLVLHTDAGRTFSTVRRMKAEKAMGLPINLRTRSTISVKTGKAANEMSNDGWEALYNSLVRQLESNYPDLHAQLFSAEH